MFTTDTATIFHASIVLSVESVEKSTIHRLAGQTIESLNYGASEDEGEYSLIDLRLH